MPEGSSGAWWSSIEDIGCTSKKVKTRALVLINRYINITINDSSESTGVRLPKNLLAECQFTPGPLHFCIAPSAQIHHNVCESRGKRWSGFASDGHHNLAGRGSTLGGVGGIGIGGRWSTPDLAYGGVLPLDSALPVPSDTDAGWDAPGPLPPTARVEPGSASPHWLPRTCHPPTAACPRPDPLLYTAARSAQTVVQTGSTPETVRVGSWRTSKDAGSLD